MTIMPASGTISLLQFYHCWDGSGLTQYTNILSYRGHQYYYYAAGGAVGGPTVYGSGTLSLGSFYNTGYYGEGGGGGK